MVRDGEAKVQGAQPKPQVPFAYKLVLNQWLLSLFNVKCFEDLAEHFCVARRWKVWMRTTFTTFITL